MNSISERAIRATMGRPTAGIVSEIPRDHTDRDRLREEWRLAADLLVNLDDEYQRRKEGKSIFFDELVETLLDQAPVEDGKKKMSAETAKRMANISQPHKDYLRKMHDARLAMARQRVEVENLDRIYWQHVSREATERKERGMSR